MIVYLHGGYRHGHTIELENDHGRWPIQVPVPTDNVASFGTPDYVPITEVEQYEYQFTLSGYEGDNLHVFATDVCSPADVLYKLSGDYVRLSKQGAHRGLEDDRRRLQSKVESLTADLDYVRRELAQYKELADVVKRIYISRP